MVLTPYKPSLWISAALAMVLIACGWYFDATLIAMLCVAAALWQVLRLLYYLLRWNRAGLAAGGIRLLIWVAATAGVIGAYSHQFTLTQTRGEALVNALQAYRAREGRYPQNLEALAPRDIAAVPLVALSPIHEQKFRYRLMENSFRLMFVTGIRAAKEYDSEKGTWESLD